MLEHGLFFHQVGLLLAGELLCEGEFEGVESVLCEERGGDGDDVMAVVRVPGAFPPDALPGWLRRWWRWW